MKKQFFYGSDKLTVKIAISLAEGTIKGILDDKTREGIIKSQQHVQQMVDSGKTV